MLTETPADMTGAPVADSLVDLLKTQHNMLANLRRLREFAAHLDMDTVECELLDDMIDRIEKHRFTVAVVGEFNRGKSTFVNALMGEEILPADILPATATLNRVTYDLRPYVEIVYRHARAEEPRREEIDVDQLAAYVTKLTDDARARAAEIKEAVVHFDNKYLRNQVDIIDTPGLNDSDAMTSITMDVLPYSDVAIMVLMPENPFGGYEGDFLDQLLLNDLGRVLFVVNAIDRVAPEDRPRLLEAIETRIQESVQRKAEARFGSGPETQDERQLHIKRIGRPKVFGISAQDALDGKLQNDTVLLAESGFLEFERYLESFLTRERGVIALQTLAARMVASGNKLAQRLTQLIGASRMTQQEFDTVYQTTGVELEQLRGQLVEQLRQIDEAAERTRLKVRPELGKLGEAMRAVAAQVIDHTPITAHDIRKENHAALLDRISREVTSATDSVGRAMAERVQFMIEEDVNEILKDICELSSAVDRSIHTLNLVFDDAIKGASTGSSAKHQAVFVGAGVSLFVGSGWLIPLAMHAAGVSLVIVALPIALAVFAGIGLASLLTGKALSRVVFQQERIEGFRKAFRDAALVQINQQFHAQYPALEHQFFEHINDTYAVVKRNVRRELGSAIDQTQRNLEDISRMRQRSETLTEVKLQEYERQLTEVQRIVGKAYGLSNELRDISEPGE